MSTLPCISAEEFEVILSKSPVVIFNGKETKNILLWDDKIPSRLLAIIDHVEIPYRGNEEIEIENGNYLLKSGNKYIKLRIK